MKNKFLSIFFLSVFTISPAQQNEQKSMATFGIMSSLLNRRWTFGYIHKISERIRIGADLGYGAQGFLVPRIDKKENFKSFEIRPAFYYSLSPKSVLKHFVGADFFIIKTDKTLQNQHFYDDYQYYWADKADMCRNGARPTPCRGRCRPSARSAARRSSARRARRCGAAAAS